MTLKYKHFKDTSIIEVGIDEVGRGCLAGPVFAAAVILPDKFPDDKYKEIKDSKKLSEKKRELLFDYIIQNAKDYSIAQLSEKEIDDINILQATYTVMHKTLENLAYVPDHILIDGNSFKPYLDPKTDEYIEHSCIKGGDNVYISIAAASILAKVSRDRYIKNLCLNDPELNVKYDWIKNKAYGTKKHIEGIKRHGICEHHRKTFGICKNYV